MPDSKIKKVLIADDSQIFFAYLEILLKRIGFTSITYAKNGLEALKLLKHEKPDVIMLNIWMETIDGITVLKAVKEDEQMSHILVIMVSGDESKETVEKCRSLGCVGYLTKPVRADNLHNALEECLLS